ncbi:MAG: sensor histidine kinase [Desulfobacteraceae bacterium]|nr:MAG: sensor histidine kinase [Desulfobacteraceae bacterium]
MMLLEKIKPAFWNVRPSSPGASRYLFNYRRIWKWSILLTGVVALVPLIFITLVDYKVTEQALEQEFRLRTARVVSNARRVIGFFLSERQSALDFIVRDNSPAALSDPERLEAILGSLKKSFGGGFMDLGVIGADGDQIAYVGPFRLEHKDYHDQPWFQLVVDRGIYISDVFLGYRQVPHLIIAVKQSLPDGSFQVLRASLGIKPFEELLAHMELSGLGDAFIVNARGILQTNSRYYGRVLDKLSLPVPEYYPSTQVMEGANARGETLLVGYRFIEGTPFILMVAKSQQDLMQPWRSTRLKLILFLVFSVTLILAVIFGTATYMVRNMHLADEKRLMSLHQVEYANKMASIGRMAAGVAHEINNPLAIINEKAGLIKDLFTIKRQYAADEKLIGIVDAIIGSVQRAGKITKRLLTFARNFDASIEKLKLEEVVREVISFVEREAQVRAIQIRLDIAANIAPIETDRGKLQQILLNIINNAFAAMGDDGHLEIGVQPVADGVSMRICDDGCGIPAEDLHRIFEPFFSTKTGQGGTGLGLSITYNLVHEIGAEIEVTSAVGQGTCFTIHLPGSMSRKGQDHACTFSG